MQRFSPLHSRAPPLCCKQNVNVFQALRYISAISGMVLSTTMVCREQWSRDQCSVSWISEGDILCKFISHCEQSSQLVNSTVCTTALFTHSLQSTRIFPPASFPCIPSITMLSPSALITAHCGSPGHQRCTQTHTDSMQGSVHTQNTYTHAHEETPIHSKISDPPAFGAITVHCLPTPSLIFIFLYHHITLILLYLLHTRLPTKNPWSSDT